jgi:SapC
VSTSFYQKPVLVNPVLHSGFKIAPLRNYDFVAHTHAVFVAGIEFGDAGKEYPIVFTRISGEICPVVMFGLRESENLFVREDGVWLGNYLPAFVRRYPFVLANIKGLAADTQLGVCVDEAYAGWNAQDGEALFDDQKAQTPYFKRAIDFLTRYQQEHSRTIQFCKRLDALGLLEAMDAQARLPNGRTFQINGLMVVQESRLTSLGDVPALALFRSGDLALIHSHLSSLSNLQQLLYRLEKGEKRPDFADTLSGAT